jgi:hypothetical protein
MKPGFSPSASRLHMHHGHECSDPRTSRSKPTWNGLDCESTYCHHVDTRNPSSEADTRIPFIVGAAPWGVDGDWQTHLRDHRTREPDSLVHAFNTPIETSPSPTSETLPSFTALGHDQCVAALQNTFGDHQKLIARLDVLAREEEGTKKAYEVAVSRKEEV